MVPVDAEIVSDVDTDELRDFAHCWKYSGVPATTRTQGALTTLATVWPMSQATQQGLPSVFGERHPEYELFVSPDGIRRSENAESVVL